MAPNAQDYTKLLDEFKKSRNAADFLLDFVDLIKANSDFISGDTKSNAEKIANAAESIHSSVEELTTAVNEDLNKIPIDELELKDAGQKLLLYQDKQHAILHCQHQMANHQKGSYWYKYWEFILNDILNMEE
jgi:hypothetical protein